ncbi:30S ribosomal protein S12 methylthiotransferase RimO [Clostridium cylindrosporum]|uniref:Ribosomal protein uS12 methylthiotransferase RimO n=1 Tax=Clostridium cylindrosporum DSM 605 TaxID=1121307 RepID=A0A0J8DAJ4_CLOCY|nr:30S ribosomal protein S12 methylthiotransferase RimO [Clostridium cylindrosporum]KMT23050.1 ribosomal protein S12 methylthiotransferase RimO [Clostridium cylindrosporum DSM 605]
MTYNVGMVSLGCDKNRVDAEIMLSILSREGYNLVTDPKTADVIIVNTCGFIESAKEESINTILEMSENKELGKCKSVIVTGCMAERYKNELMSEMPEIDAIIGTGTYRQIAEIVKKTLSGETGIINTGEINYDLDYEKRILSTPSHYGYVKIAEGCNNNCSYCIIPKLRGRFRSRSMESIVKEVNDIVDQGVKEIILVAQDTTKYGIDIYGEKRLPKLIAELEKIENLKWIRIMYSYPEDVTDELIDTIANSPKACKYFDIPIQHISDNVLKSMRRTTSKEEILNLITKIKTRIPNAIIRTSLIVGFPGETKDDFEELRSFIKMNLLDRVGIFTYSPEEGTVAANLENQIEENIKESRKNTLMQLQSSNSLENNKKLIGEVFEVLIEGKSDNNQYYGRTYQDAPGIDQNIYVNSESKLKLGDFVNVEVKKAYTYDLIGDVYNESSK